ncbi:MAG TPA: tetratricopeptide repeat protein, partial [Geobacteraceae bacterium]|nr:tetratricopeptide repeat protein [Geobacteraceae bacterium]
QEYEIARTCFSEAIALNGNLAPAYFGLGAVEQSAGGDPGLARELYLKAVELNPSNPQFHHALGNLLAAERDPDALAHFAAAAQLHPNRENLQRDFGNACLQLGQGEEGVDHLRLALEQNPDDAMASELLARAERDNPGSP